MEIIILIGFLSSLFTGGLLVLGLIYILLKYTLGLILIFLNLVLLLPCYLYEKVTKKMAPDWIFKVAALIGKLNPINWIDLFD